MKTKSLILIAVALGCGLMAAVGISQVLGRTSTGGGTAKVNTAPILVAITNLDIGAPLTAESLRLEQWPAEKIPEGAISDWAKVDGTYTRVRLAKGQVIANDMLMDQKNETVVKIPDGYRVMSILVTIDEAISGLLQPGDRVDITGFFRKNSDYGKTVAKTFMFDVRVFAVNEKTEREIDPEGKTILAKTVSLLVKPEQVETLMTASELGKLRLSLRSPYDTGTAQTDGKGLAEILGDPSERGSDERSPREMAQKSANDFTAWLDGMKKRSTEAADVAAVNAAARITMIVHSPNGAVQYTWNDPNKLPEALDLGAGGAPATAPALPSVPKSPAADGHNAGNGGSDGNGGPAAGSEVETPVAD